MQLVSFVYIVEIGVIHRWTDDLMTNIVAKALVAETSANAVTKWKDTNEVAKKVDIRHGGNAQSVKNAVQLNAGSLIPNIAATVARKQTRRSGEAENECQIYLIAIARMNANWTEKGSDQMKAGSADKKANAIRNEVSRPRNAVQTEADSMSGETINAKRRASTTMTIAVTAETVPEMVVETLPEMPAETIDSRKTDGRKSNENSTTVRVIDRAMKDRGNQNEIALNEMHEIDARRAEVQIEVCLIIY